MAKKAKSKKRPIDIVTPRELRARAEMRSVARAVKMQRRTKALTRTLERALTSADGALMAVASIVAARVGYGFEKKVPLV